MCRERVFTEESSMAEDDGPAVILRIRGDWEWNRSGKAD
jgi:hypothetical protein